MDKNGGAPKDEQIIDKQEEEIKYLNNLSAKMDQIDNVKLNEVDHEGIPKDS